MTLKKASLKKKKLGINLQSILAALTCVNINYFLWQNHSNHQLLWLALVLIHLILMVKHRRPQITLFPFFSKIE